MSLPCEYTMTRDIWDKWPDPPSDGCHVMFLFHPDCPNPWRRTILFFIIPLLASELYEEFSRWQQGEVSTGPKHWTDSGSGQVDGYNWTDRGSFRKQVQTNLRLSRWAILHLPNYHKVLENCHSLQFWYCLNQSCCEWGLTVSVPKIMLHWVRDWYLCLAPLPSLCDN